MTSDEQVRQHYRRPGDRPAEALVVLPGPRDRVAGSDVDDVDDGHGEHTGRRRPADRPFDGLRVAASVDDADAPRDVLDMLALDAFVTGRQPFARTVRLEHVLPDAPLRPDNAGVLREAVDEHGVARLVDGDGWSLLTSHWRQSRQATLVATAVTPELAELVLARASVGAVASPPPTPDRVAIGFWHRTTTGPRRIQRDIDAEPWERIRGNYAGRAAAAVDVLVGQRSTSATGRLLLLHGPPGTGKTTLLRTLARAWQSWCQVDCVLDPETLLADPSYLLQVALGAEDDDESGEERWRLMVLKDCDELISAQARISSGQALSRLLNLTDGLLGQGRKVLVAITTNEDLTGLHPAVTRPGRSLAHLEVGRLSPSEAVAWLDGARPTEAVLRDGATLAELYAMRDGTAAVSVAATPEAYGCYL